MKRIPLSVLEGRAARRPNKIPFGVKRTPLSVLKERAARRPQKVNWTMAEDLKIILLAERLRGVGKWKLIDKILGYSRGQCFERYEIILHLREDAKIPLDLKKQKSIPSQDEVVPKFPPSPKKHSIQALNVPVEGNTRMKLLSEVSKLQSAADAIVMELCALNSDSVEMGGDGLSLNVPVEANTKLKILDIISTVRRAVNVIVMELSSMNLDPTKRTWDGNCSSVVPADDSTRLKILHEISKLQDAVIAAVVDLSSVKFDYAKWRQEDTEEDSPTSPTSESNVPKRSRRL